MSIRSCLVPAVVLSVNLCVTPIATAEEGNIFTGQQAIQEDMADAGHPSRPKGALEKGGEPLGETAPLNGDRAASTATSPRCSLNRNPPTSLVTPRAQKRPKG